MAATPRFKVFNAHGVYAAACHAIEDAAHLVAFYGDGATIRDGHTKRSILWQEGSEAQPAAESYDVVAGTVVARMQARSDALARVTP